MGRSFGPVLEGIRRPRPPQVSQLWVKIDGVNTASPGGYLHSPKTRARWAAGFHDELNDHVFDLERDGLRQVVPCPWLTTWWKQTVIPYGSVAAQVNKDRAFRRTPGRRCQVCYWCIIIAKSQRAVENREKWRKLFVKSSVVPQRPSRLRDRWWW